MAMWECQLMQIRVWGMLGLEKNGECVKVHIKQPSPSNTNTNVTSHILHSDSFLVLPADTDSGLWLRPMDQISIKKPNCKCRLYWCFIQFMDWRYSQSCWYFRPLLWTSAPLTFSLVHLPSHLFPQGYVFIQCITGWEGDRRPQTDKHLPSISFSGQFLRKADLGFGV